MLQSLILYSMSGQYSSTFVSFLWSTLSQHRGSHPNWVIDDWFCKIYKLINYTIIDIIIIWWIIQLRVRSTYSKWRSMKWYFCFLNNKGSFHAAIRTAILKQSWSISLFSSKISLIFSGTHSLLKNKDKEQITYSNTDNGNI